MILHDKDGTLTGTAQSKVLATTGLLPPTCTKSEHFSSLMPASICPPDVKFHRFAFNKVRLLFLIFFGSSFYYNLMRYYLVPNADVAVNFLLRYNVNFNALIVICQ